MKNLNVETLVYFGDSWTDTGNFFELTTNGGVGPAPSSELGYQQQFSNDLMFSDRVPELLGVAGNPDLNFAVVGAQGSQDRTFGDVFQPFGFVDETSDPDVLNFRLDLTAQIDRFLDGAASELDLSSTAASVFIGVNDANFTTLDPDGNVAAEAFAAGLEAGARTVAEATRLAEAGVGTIILHTLPFQTDLPFLDGFPEFFRENSASIVDGFNAGVADGIAAIEALGSEVVVVDFQTLFNEVVADPTAFGFRNFEDTINLGIGAEANPDTADIPADQLALVDVLHPSGAMQGVMAAFQAESLTSEVEIGSNENDLIRGSKADDLVVSRDGDDSVYARKGDDVVLAGLGDDTVFGGHGDDLISGGSGNDWLLGGKGNDVLGDGGGDDIVRGGRGHDLLIDGAGNDLHFGGEGDDVFIFTDAALTGGTENGDNVFIGGRGNDTLVLRLDEGTELGQVHEWGQFNYFADLGIKAIGIEEIVISNGLEDELTPIAADVEAADLWGLI